MYTKIYIFFLKKYYFFSITKLYLCSEKKYQTIFQLFFMKIFNIIILVIISLHSFSQNCIDYIILNVEGNSAKTDTVFCKLISEDEESVVIDNGYALTTLKRSLITGIQCCAREMTLHEIYKFRGLDAITADMFYNQNTVGAYLRKAARNTYLATGLAIAGSGVVCMGIFWVKANAGKTACYITGGVTIATSLFFVIRGWNQIYKAGKLLDINAQTSLYLNSNQDGIGLSLKF
jgi:hypothetical protein